MNYMDKGVIRELSDDLIKRASNGEEKALERILEIFNPYITAVSTFERISPDGQLHSYIDEDMKIQVQMKIVDALQNKWRKLI